MKKMILATKLAVVCMLSCCNLVVNAQCSVESAIDSLREGNKRFCENRMVHQHQDLTRIKELTEGQHPFAVVISCSDSRVTPEIVFDQGLGDLFSIRTAGNVMADFEEGSVEYAVDHLNTKLVVVLGHTCCGAVKAFLDTKENNEGHEHHHGDLGHIQSIIDKFDSEEEEQECLKKKEDLYNQAILANVKNGVRQLRESDPILAKMQKEHKIEIVGAIYHIENGVVEFLNL
ncbi:carbonic anhydrase [Bacteroides sp. 224]|uniref:carbonic anhydrase n=1 Tax=Bacteroides sp. 224 TaxID=2302936 RepID=UPI0013D502DB|nr:carbonic anhydrase [Bacteroides sp. 224]NDV64159.1 carbonic anhydrase [Bacteroides sp. 224]